MGGLPPTFLIIMAKTKYNVDKETVKRTFDGIVFDSRLEMQFYRDMVLPKFESGEIKHYELQKVFILQPGFRRDGKSILPIKYVADFYLKYADGRVEVVDTKGMPDTAANLKRKMMWYHYPDLDYKWMSYTKATGWVTYDELKKIRSERKKGKDK